MANSFMYGWGIDISNAPSFKKAAALQNFRSGRRCFARYSELAAHTTSYEGYTETISERTMREGLLWYPLVTIFRVGDTWINLPAVPGGRGFNAQGNFGDCFAYGKNGRVYHVNLHIPGEDENAFLSRTPGPETPGEYEGYAIRANDSCTPMIDTVIFYSEQIADLLSAVANCTPLLHHPIDFQVSQKQRTTALKWFKELDSNIPIMFTPLAEDGGSLMNVAPVNLLANGDIIKPTIEALDWFDQRCLTEIGVKNMGSQVDKKGENLLTDEVNGTDTVTSLVVKNQVNLINLQIKEQGINKITGLENFRCVNEMEKINNAFDIQRVDREERDTMDDGDSRE